MAEEEPLSAATNFLRGLAQNAGPSYNTPDLGLHTKGSTTNGGLALPAPTSGAKQSFEKELLALAARVQYLEAKASTVSHHNLPDTPSEFGAPSSPFMNGSTSIARNGASRPARQLSGSTRQARVSNLLTGNSLTFTPDDLEHLRDHVEKQAEQIKSQAETIFDVKEQLLEQKQHAAQRLDRVENDGIGKLQRELLKHQQANEAFQKALKEIGTIITNVANGDLSQKVQIHLVEMDPEIATFKRTINTMMDQLQVFGNEVSRVAREVGTEGKLGGQAQITGVSGVWKDLTQNGELSMGT